MEIAVQICGKVRARITVPSGAPEEQVRQAALAEPAIAAQLAGKSVKKVIVVKDKLVNIVAV